MNDAPEIIWTDESDRSRKAHETSRGTEMKMIVRHLSHTRGEWFDVVDEDPDCDFETGEYIGLNDMMKFSNGDWYPKNECQYVDNHGNVKSCCSQEKHND